MKMTIPTEWIAFIAIILGVIGRTYFPYLKKLGEYKVEIAGTGTTALTFSFDYKFIVTAVFSGIVSAMFIFPMFVIPENVSTLSLFIAAFIFSWGTNDVINSLTN